MASVAATGESEKAYIDVYHEGQVQRLKFYRGTSADDFLGLILKMFHKLPESPTPSDISNLKLQCVFYDEDGDPLCFSPDVIPSGTKLYLRIQSFSLSGYVQLQPAMTHNVQSRNGHGTPLLMLPLKLHTNYLRITLLLRMRLWILPSIQCQFCVVQPLLKVDSTDGEYHSQIPKDIMLSG